MQPTEYYRDMAKTCISMMVHQLVSAMQHYNVYAGKDNRSAGLYNNDVQQSCRLLASCGFKPNIEQVDVVKEDGNHYLVYKSLDFEKYSIQLRDLGVTDDIGNSGDNTIHEFTY
ncbi:MAG: hypothetical protein IJZ68_06690 [Bacteroidaceae bacterium]|nr:hypothetical protein [Bacteroidaceae bacterium]